MRRMFPSVLAQRIAISSYLVKFAGRRPSEAAMEAATMGVTRRRRWWLTLSGHGCLERAGDGHWRAVKALPSKETEQSATEGGR